ncbi:hypothetical protein ACNFIA_25265 [Pseudomonas sp. NY15437]|uniref:hypothetical protein n=1 Tax=Pseudomonas sp. NY15437 TaxID=3400360 RepID=UPI003A89C0A1
MSLLEMLGDLCSALFDWPGSGQKSNRVFSPEFVACCIIVAVLELAVLHALFGATTQG